MSLELAGVVWRSSWWLGSRRSFTPSRSSSPSRLLRPAQTTLLKSTKGGAAVRLFVCDCKTKMWFSCCVVRVGYWRHETIVFTRVVASFLPTQLCDCGSVMVPFDFKYLYPFWVAGCCGSLCAGFRCCYEVVLRGGHAEVEKELINSVVVYSNGRVVF
ncbi:hypothetical protein Taro_039609 [Colocasia esculenta]|uniref:Uncharacterized protein n=1 Tax=Colocasia esculenta TaxID=4460 RepID=A0A843WW78_COLES|nr:hypothetical protein [Colocasia esculenta]